jgi:hypothetical protein
MSSEEYAAYVDRLKATNPDLTPEDKKEIQRQKRLIRNREYAQKKRRSNKEKSEHINLTVETQQHTISTLQDENNYLKSELSRLKSMLACVLPNQQHHIIETPPVLPISNPQKKRRKDGQTNASSSAMGQTVLFVFLLSFGATISTVFLIPDGVVSSSLRGAGRGLLSEGSPLSYPVGKVMEIFWPVVEPSEEGKSISTVNSSGLESANLNRQQHPPEPKPEVEPELSEEPFDPESHYRMCDGMLQEVDNETTVPPTQETEVELPTDEEVD